MARNIYAVFLNDFGTSELGKLFPFWIKEFPPLGGYLYCRKFETGEPDLMSLQVDSKNGMGQAVEFELRIQSDYVRAIVKAADLEKIGIIGMP